MWKRGDEGEQREEERVEAGGGCVVCAEVGDEGCLVCVGVSVGWKVIRKGERVGKYLVRPCLALQRLRRRIRRDIEMCGGGVMLPCCVPSLVCDL